MNVLPVIKNLILCLFEWYLHATVINDYGVIFDFGIQLCHLCTALQKQAIT